MPRCTTGAAGCVDVVPPHSPTQPQTQATSSVRPQACKLRMQQEADAAGKEVSMPLVDSYWSVGSLSASDYCSAGKEVSRPPMDSYWSFGSLFASDYRSAAGKEVSRAFELEDCIEVASSGTGGAAARRCRGRQDPRGQYKAAYALHMVSTLTVSNVLKIICRPGVRFVLLFSALMDLVMCGSCQHARVLRA